MITRRTFLTASAVAFAATLPGLPGPAAARRIAIVGGGTAGAAAAARLRAAAPEAAVTLLDRHPSRAAARLIDAGVRVHAAEVVDVDWGRHRVLDRNRSRHAFDTLILAPGVAFRTGEIGGYDGLAQTEMPHFWSGPEDEERFLAWVAAMETGGTVLVTVPRRPHRFMAGPYLRAERAAAYLAVHNPRGKVLLLDSNADPLPAFAGTVERIVARPVFVDRNRRVIRTDAGNFRGDVVNLIPDQWAGPLAESCGLADRTGWCPIDAATCRSSIRENALVIGDAADSTDSDKDAERCLAMAKLAANRLPRT